jgi:hypothetical protein
MNTKTKDTRGSTLTQKGVQDHCELNIYLRPPLPYWFLCHVHNTMTHLKFSYYDYEQYNLPTRDVV